MPTNEELAQKIADLEKLVTGAADVAQKHGLEHTDEGNDPIEQDDASGHGHKGPHFIKEQADADADVAGQGQVWVNTATPNELYFTNDAGTDRRLDLLESHNLLNNTAHPDAATATAVRGDILVANSTPDFARVAVGAAESIITSDGTDPVYRPHYHSWGFAIPSPTTSTDHVFGNSGKGAVTITEVVGVVKGTTPSVTFNIRHSANRTTTTTEVWTTDEVLTNTTIGESWSGAGLTSDVTVVVDSWVWVNVSAVSGTIDSFEVVVFYTFD